MVAVTSPVSVSATVLINIGFAMWGEEGRQEPVKMPASVLDASDELGCQRWPGRSLTIAVCRMCITDAQLKTVCSCRSHCEGSVLMLEHCEGGVLMQEPLWRQHGDVATLQCVCYILDHWNALFKLVHRSSWYCMELSPPLHALWAQHYIQLVG